ncbi:Uu.00g054030.m01.CDS01 [Anthostomella pinea]|uniref:Uu.00g054030.m01.CDS01 n=1 Tax=Anthostomella pinea TaxID=933095 RepID=A0AAI8VXS2_9PEZI|nr:Uu.00g054030.m01.CDS01 [Anthostomella pinea]
MSTYSSSGSSRAAFPGPYARKISLTSKPNMAIHIDNHYRSKVYTTSSEVSGHVDISPANDVRFDTLQILLLGTSRTRVDAVSIPQATSHTFLKLTMPIPESSYPVPRVFETGRTYKVPFNFVIPSHLTLNACNHKVCNDSVQEHHVRLPPSVGGWEKDDFAPNMSRVNYCIKARVLRDEEVGAPAVKVMEEGKEIKVLPAVPEDAPLNVTAQDKLYTMSRSKTLRKSILSAKSGKVTVSANQPAPAMMTPDGHSVSPTTAQLDLEFEPTSSNESQPPRVTGVTAKVMAVSFYSAGPINHYPNLKDWARGFGAEGRGCYTGSVSLGATAPVGKVAWKQHLTCQARRDSGYCTDDTDQTVESPRIASPAGNSNKKHSSKTSPYYHTTSLQIPIRLPTAKRQFIPTFHSCITSRVYVLALTVSLSSGSGSTNGSVTLELPLQIGVDVLAAPRVDPSGLPSFEAAMEDAAVDELLRPRVLGLGRLAGGEVLPGYARRDGVAVR